MYDRKLMKRLFWTTVINTLILTTIVLGLTAGSCDPPKYDKPRYDPKIGEFTILTIDSCEYIVFHNGNATWGSHKGNCKNPIHNR